MPTELRYLSNGIDWSSVELAIRANHVIVCAAQPSIDRTCNSARSTYV